MRDHWVVALMRNLRQVSDENIAGGMTKPVHKREFKNAIENMSKYRLPLQKVIDPKP